MVIFGISIILAIIFIPIIALCVESARTSTIKKRFEREYQEKQKLREREFAAKKSELTQREQNVEQRERKVAQRDERWKTVDKVSEWASRRLRIADERERDLARQEYALEQREQLLHRDLEAIIDYRVEEGIKGKEKGLTDDWRNLFRKSRVLEEDKQKMYKRAVLLASHLGVPEKCFLSAQERQLVGKITNELTEERYALIDLVMSCPDDQAKDLLTAMQRFLQK